MIPDSLAAELAAADVLMPAFWLGAVTTLVRAAIIVGLGLAVMALVRRVQARWTARASAATDGHGHRLLTVAGLLGSVARYVVWAIVAITILSEVGVEVGPLLASAGIAGLAVGFGAQTLVKDVISGFFLLFDGTIGHGDLITFNGKTGTVEYVGLRLIKVRTFDGELVMIPAGELRVFGNKSVGFARVIVDVGLSYEQDVSRALAALEGVAGEWAATDGARAILLEEKPQVQAITELGESAVTARIIAQVRPGEQFQAERDLRRLVKERFDEQGIEIPFPHRTVYVKQVSADAPAPEDGENPLDVASAGAAGA